MQKSALGKNLGSLLGRGSVAGGPVGSLPPKTQTIGPGVRSLMRGHHAESPFAEPEIAASNRIQARMVPRWYLFAGDILLVVLATVVFYRSAKLGWKEELFAILAVALGGCLSVMAVIITPPEAEPAAELKTET